MPHQSYENAAGKRVPSVTTVLKLKDPEPLIIWANKLGLQGIDCRAARDDAATAGTIAHELIDANLKNREPVLPTEEQIKRDAFTYQEIMQRAERAFDNFCVWKKSVDFEVVATEVPLVSEQYQFGGCLDAVGKVNGYTLLCDWKASRGVYFEYLMQVSGYRHLWEENNPGSKLDGVKLLRLDKESAEWHQYTWTAAEIAPAFESFLARLQAYRADYLTRKAFRAGRHMVGLVA